MVKKIVQVKAQGVFITDFPNGKPATVGYTGNKFKKKLLELISKIRNYEGRS